MEAISEIKRECINKHFVYIFGQEASGKTTVITAMYNAMQRQTASSRLIISRGKNIFNNNYREHIFRSAELMSQGMFPYRTVLNHRNWVHMERWQEDAKKEDLVFWEFAGEGFSEIDFSTQTSSSLPIEASICVNAGIKTTLIFTIELNKLHDYDLHLSKFISNVIQELMPGENTHIFLIVTKCDMIKDQKIDFLYIKNRLGNLTSNQLEILKERYTVAISVFTVGHIGVDEDGMNFIRLYDHQPAERIFEKITATGKPTQKWREFISKFI